MTHGCHTAAIRSPYGESYLHDPLTRDNKTAVADDRNGLVDFDTCRVEPSLEGTEPPSPPTVPRFRGGSCRLEPGGDVSVALP